MIFRPLLFAVLMLSVASYGAHPAFAHDEAEHRHDGASHGATDTDGAPGKPGDVKRTVRIEATDNAFNVKQIQVRAGETIKFIISNAGYATHEFAIASPKENAEHREMMRQMPNMVHHDPNVITIEPGETKELLWKFGKDRNVEFSCNIRNHAEQGMHGVFRVMQ